MGKRKWDERNYGVTWADFRHWADALLEDFRAQVSVEVSVPAAFYHLSGVVRVVVYVPGVGTERRELWSDYQELHMEHTRHVEHVAVMLASRAWLDLDLKRSVAVQQALFR